MSIVVCTMALNFISGIWALVVIDTIAIQLSIDMLTSGTSSELERKEGIVFGFSGCRIVESTE
jgi:hypothetical protein